MAEQVLGSCLALAQLFRQLMKASGTVEIAAGAKATVAKLCGNLLTAGPS